MNKDITTLLKEATKDLLTEDTLKEIETTFDSAVTDKVKIHVEKALMEQDTDYTAKLEKLLEAIDKDHTKKLEKVVESIESNHTAKLQKVVNKYRGTIFEEAGKFKGTLVSRISKYLDLYLEEKLPQSSINEAVKNKKAGNLLGSLRNILAVDAALVKESIRDAVIDGKKQLDEARKQLDVAQKELAQQKTKSIATESTVVLESMVAELPTEKKRYMRKIFASKPLEFIKENFDYTLKLFDKTEEDRIEQLKAEAISGSKETTVDRPNVEEVITENVQDTSPASAEDHPEINTYMKELGKY